MQRRPIDLGFVIARGLNHELTVWAAYDYGT